jgi:hypothetical protein
MAEKRTSRFDRSVPTFSNSIDYSNQLVQHAKIRSKKKFINIITSRPPTGRTTPSMPSARVRAAA